MTRPYETWWASLRHGGLLIAPSRLGAASRRVAVPVDFYGLGTEYIGILYEGLLDYELRRRDDDVTVVLNMGDCPTLPLEARTLPGEVGKPWGCLSPQVSDSLSILPDIARRRRRIILRLGVNYGQGVLKAP